MKLGTHIWYAEQVWIVDYYCDITCRMDITSCLQEFGKTIPDTYFKLPINDLNYAKILWTP